MTFTIYICATNPQHGLRVLLGSICTYLGVDQSMTRLDLSHSFNWLEFGSTQAKNFDSGTAQSRPIQSRQFSPRQFSPRHFSPTTIQSQTDQSQDISVPKCSVQKFSVPDSSVLKHFSPANSVPN